MGRAARPPATGRPLRWGPCAVLLAWVALAVPAAGAGAPPVARLSSVGAAPPSAQLDLVVPLVADDAGLERFALAVSTPGSPAYGRFASLRELARRFGASAHVAAAAMRYLRSIGARRVELSPTRMYVQATVSVGAAERAFRAPLSVLQAADGRRFVAPAARLAGGREAIALPAALHGVATGVVGLDAERLVGDRISDPARAGTAASGSMPSAYAPRSGTAAGCRSARRSRGFTPNQYLSAYGFDALHAAGFRGAGERVALIEIDGFKSADVRTFARCFSIHVPRIRTYTVGFGKPLAPGGESTLDLELLVAAAPRATSLDVYENRGNAAQVLRAFTAPLIAPGGKPDVVSASLGICEPFVDISMGASGIQSIERDLQLAASAGITVLASAGDQGSSACQGSSGSIIPELAVSYPASSAFVTAVGGTNLVLSRANRIVSERVWNDTYLTAGAGGGGFSQFSRPGYQSTVVGVNSRVVPDISALADLAPGYAIYCSSGDSACHGWTSVGGTSAAAPLLAGAFALIDQDAHRHHRRIVGQANPLIYRLARGSGARRIFHDVTSGGNDLGPFLPGNGGHALGCCDAHAGFDAASGWGSIDVTAFAAAALRVLPPAPDISLQLPAAQHPIAARGLAGRVACSGPCRIFMSGEVVLAGTSAFPVRSAAHVLHAAGSSALAIPLNAAQRTRLRSALRAGHHPYAELFGVAVDAAGQPLTVTPAQILPISG